MNRGNCVATEQKLVLKCHVLKLVPFVFKHNIDLICWQVQKIDIGYAKTAKKMDVKKLKGAMWGLLTENGEGNKVC